MAFSWSTFRRTAAAAWLWVAATALPGPARAEPVESIRARGLVAGPLPNPPPKGEGITETLFLIGEVHRCGGEQTLPEAQIFVSSDGGKSWQKRGPALAGSEILFARAADHTLWAAGEHTAEGPATDPFVLVPAQAATPDWTARSITAGTAQLLGVGVAGAQDLTARVRATGPHGEKTGAGTQDYVSHDGGLSWSRQKAAAAGPSHPLPRVSMRSGAWRLVDRKDGGFDVQKRAGGGWTTVTPFPWNHCPE
jgi:BNR/Asp-box repeat